MSKNKIKYHFLYKTTNLINNKYYYGMHSTYKLDDGYLGSGKRLRYSIRKYGKENFILDIIDFYNSREELVNAEVLLITEELINDSLCMNLKKGGMGGICSKEHHNKMRLGSSIYQKNRWIDDYDFIEKTSLLYSIKAKNRWENGGLSKDIIHHKDRKYHKHTIDTKEKMSLLRKGTGIGDKNSQFGTCWITKEGENKKIKKKQFEDYLNDGWIKGRNTKKDLVD